MAHQFNNEPVRILLASLASGLRPTDSFIAGKLQKHLLREIKLADAAVDNPELLKWNKATKRYAMKDGQKTGKQREEEEEKEGDNDDDSDEDGEGQSLIADAEDAPRLPTKHNPVMLAMYGQSCNAARSYQSALCMLCFIVPDFCSLNELANKDRISVYLLHAWDCCTDDPVISLSLAIASIGRAMQRQADNRHQLIAQVSVILLLS
jgi:general transcription factor 3C polypeptide 3 (transcription factor C subunit 4)